MSLIIGTTVLTHDSDNELILYTGTGNLLRCYKEDFLQQEKEVFAFSDRIKGICVYGECLVIWANSNVKVVNKYNFDVILSFSFEDYVLDAKFISTKFIKAILYHGQFIDINDSVISRNSSPFWRILTSALITNNLIFTGDSFGNITIFLHNGTVYSTMRTEYGAIFGISFFESQKLLVTCHEYHAAMGFSVINDVIERIWVLKDHLSRVWGSFLYHNQVYTYGEDGYIRSFCGFELNLHKSKNILAVSVSNNNIVSSGDDCLIRKFSIPQFSATNNVFICSKCLSFVINDEKCVFASLSDGSLIRFPDKTIIIEPGVSSGWFLLRSFHNVIYGSSKNKMCFLYSDSFLRIIDMSQNGLVVSATLCDQYIFHVSSSNHLFVTDYWFEVMFMVDLNQYMKIVPLCLSYCQSENVIAFSSNGGVVIVKFGDNMDMVVQSWVINDFIDGVLFMQFFDKKLYCGSRGDGIIGIVSKQKDKWCYKSNWRIPNGSKSIIGLSCIEKDCIVVGALLKDTVVVWDILTQTQVFKFKYHGNKSRISIHYSSDFSYAWSDQNKICFCSDNNLILPINMCQSFHGLRCLSSSSMGQLLVTGGCDRDIRLWKVENMKINLLDCVQACDSGTQSLLITKDMFLFSGAGKSFLFFWKIFEGQLFLLNKYDIRKYDSASEAHSRITSIQNVFESEIIVGLSDACLLFFNLDESKENLIFKSRVCLIGVPMSISNSDHYFGISYSNGYVSIHSRTDFVVYEFDNGIHSIQIVETPSLLAFLACDDGKVITIELDNNMIIIQSNISARIHSGGIKCIKVRSVSNDVIHLISYSYDQKLSNIIFELNTREIKASDICFTAVSESECLEIINDNLICVGNGLQLISIQ